MSQAPFYRKQTLTEKLVNSKLVRTLDAWDKKLSSYIHKMHLPKIIQIYMSFFAQVCNKEGPVILMCICAFVFPLLQANPPAYYGVYYSLQYFAQGMTAFIICVMTKKHFKRPRPSLKLKNVTTRYFNIRNKEIDCSWPSGDTAQSGIFALFLWQN